MKFYLERRCMMAQEIFYPGNISFSQFKGKNIIPLQTNNLKNTIYIFYDKSQIQDYCKATEEEIQSFNKILENPKFCRAKDDIGVKMIKNNPPKCKIQINENECFESSLKYEFKILGNGKKGRIVLYELNSKNKGPLILVASHYLLNGLHSSSAKNKIYESKLKLMIPLVSYQSKGSYFPTFFKNDALQKENVSQAGKNIPMRLNN